MNYFKNLIEDKIIFLDIDGVLNGYNRWNLFGWKLVSKSKCRYLEKLYARYTNPFGIHKSKVKRLAKIVKATGAKVVMSSSWRYGWWNKPYDKQDKDQKRLTDLLNKYNIEIIDITPTLKSGHRGEEIKTWLCNHKCHVRSFIILDDENSDMSPFDKSPRFIQTSDVADGVLIKGYANENAGLKNKHISRAIKELNKNVVVNFYENYDIVVTNNTNDEDVKSSGTVFREYM